MHRLRPGLGFFLFGSRWDASLEEYDGSPGETHMDMHVAGKGSPGGMHPCTSPIIHPVRPTMDMQ